MVRGICLFLSCLLILWNIPGQAQTRENTNRSKFRQLWQELATPNMYRTASGAPGHGYWQQQADYDMTLALDDKKQRLYGEEIITYHNNSPDPLAYLWVQLDQNVRAKDADHYKIITGMIPDSITEKRLRRFKDSDFDGGFKIEFVKDKNNRPLSYVIHQTMMRVDLPAVLSSGKTFTFKIKWWYNINDRLKVRGRSGYEYFPADDNYLYTIAQFFPRMAVYNEVEGWQNKQFLGSGEFALSFGNYKVRLTVPADHLVAATGVLQNPREVLSAGEMRRLKKARSASEPVVIVSEETARQKEKKRSGEKKTWVFAAKNVRDFAFASSRKFVWDAMGVQMGKQKVLAMSFYPKEGNPLWGKYVTKVIAHTLKTYSKYTFDYPYPVAIAINVQRGGMEYPMICFNRGRPEADGTYSEKRKNGVISIICHEVGHNFFPMIVNSDERQWTWMDEGLNVFLQSLTLSAWKRDFPLRRRLERVVVEYTKGDKTRMTPIMTNSESLYQFHRNAYHKTAAALHVLRETVMGEALFDFAFKTYAQRWMFKQPAPADFFRTMEDASGMDLDWFWRGWFFTTDHVDLAIDKVRWLKIDTRDPEAQKQAAAQRPSSEARLSLVAQDSSLRDFYDAYDPNTVTVLDREAYEMYYNSLSEEAKAALKQDLNYYEVHFSNIGGVVMPLILEIIFTDSSKALRRIPAEIWRLDNEQVSKVFVTEKEIASLTLDPYRQTYDVDMENNHWPSRPQKGRFKLIPERKPSMENAMQRSQRAKAREKELKETK